MRIAQVLAGISLAEADVLRKAVGKKDAELIKGSSASSSRSRSRAATTGGSSRSSPVRSRRSAATASTSRTRSRTRSSRYHTAWLKAHYPAEFMAAILSSSHRRHGLVVKFINEAREMGIEVLPPDVNESGYKFTVLDEKRIRFGLGAIRNVGRGAIDSILAAQREQAVHVASSTSRERVDLRACNKRVFEALIASGALDGLGGHRAQYWSVLDTAMQEASLKQQEKAMGQVSLFGLRPIDGRGHGARAARAAERRADGRSRSG